MLRTLLGVLTASIIMTSCSSTLQLNNQYAQTVPVKAGSLMKEVAAPARSVKTDTRQNRLQEVISQSQENIIQHAAEIKKISAPSQLQIKYASLLNVLPAMVSNTKLFKTIDDWYGTRYRYGGTTKTGIDCSAFVRAVYSAAFGIALPRTAREQYRSVDHISSTELKEGDLVFFNTTGGVSHVGMYLSNNKFVHASSGRGVVVSDLYDTYYISRYLGAGRMQSTDNYIAANKTSRQL